MAPKNEKVYGVFTEARGEPPIFTSSDIKEVAERLVKGNSGRNQVRARNSPRADWRSLFSKEEASLFEALEEIEVGRKPEGR